jgi:hypothetical protein
MEGDDNFDKVEIDQGWGVSVMWLGGSSSQVLGVT